MHQDYKTRLTALSDKLTDVVLEEADPDNWPGADAPRDKCAHFREINGTAAAFQYLQKNYNPTASSFL